MKGARKAKVSKNGRVSIEVPYYAQTEDFSCGPACVTMALGATRKAKKLDKWLEMEIWRETNMIGIGGADPFGLAIPLLRRGLGVRIVTENLERTFPKARFRRRVKDPTDRRLIEFAIVEQRKRARAFGAKIEKRVPSLADVEAALRRGEVAIPLVHMGLVHGEDVPHWVVVTGMDEERFWIHDPYPPRGKRELELTHEELAKIMNDIKAEIRGARSLVVVEGARPA